MQTLAYMAIKFLVHSKTVNQSQSPKESGRSDLHFPIFRSFKWWVKTCCSTNLYRDRGAQRCRDSGSFEFWIGDRSLPWFIHFSSFFHTVKICKARRWRLFPYPLSLCLHLVFESLLLPFKEESALVFGARFHDILNLLETHWTDLGLWCATLKQRLEVQNSRSATSGWLATDRLHYVTLPGFLVLSIVEYIELKRGSLPRLWHDLRALLDKLINHDKSSESLSIYNVHTRLFNLGFLLVSF